MFPLWNFTAFLFLAMMVNLPYNFETDRGLGFYIALSLANYILVYVVIYSYLTMKRIKYIIIWLNPITYLALLFCFPIFAYFHNITISRKNKIHAENYTKTQMKIEAELYGPQTKEQVVLEINDYIEDVNIESYEKYYEWKIRGMNEPDIGIPGARSNQI